MYDYLNNSEEVRALDKAKEELEAENKVCARAMDPFDDHHRRARARARRCSARTSPP